MSPWSAGVCGLGCVPSRCFHTPSPSLVGQERQKRPRRYVSAAQPQLKHPSVISTVFSTNPKHSPVPATTMKILSTPAKTSTLPDEELTAIESDKTLWVFLLQGRKQRPNPAAFQEAESNQQVSQYTCFLLPSTIEAKHQKYSRQERTKPQDRVTFHLPCTHTGAHTPISIHPPATDTLPCRCLSDTHQSKK